MSLISLYVDYYDWTLYVGLKQKKFKLRCLALLFGRLCFPPIPTDVLLSLMWFPN
jgi:hypothetical protein